MTELPFRWDVARREQLGKLLDGPPADAYPGFLDELRECCVRVVAAAADGDMVFVGRSPESIFDYVSGALADTSWAARPVLLNFSMRYDSADEIRRKNIHALRAMLAQLAAVGLSPAAIAASERPQVFIDLVYAGKTFGRLLGLLEHAAEEEGVDVAAVRRRIRFLGITERTKNSPNTWRWYQRSEWAARMPRRSLRGVSIPRWLWTYLGDIQPKVARWNPPMVWGHEMLREPPRENLPALRLAYAIHQRARDPAERARFATELAACREIRDPAVRKLVLELRG
ncbi:MAG TPA: hypothetical protein VFQ39_17930 [Longimicrobium sp.]|nr:hypothetical protein [Longimicrobium sp.]